MASAYDPPRPRGDGGATTDQIQHEIDSTIKVMHENIVQTDQRGHGLNRLEDATGGLADSAGDFRRGTNRLRKKMWWKDMKMRIWLGVGIVVLLAIIIIPAVVTTR
ncbi:synaptobrevin-domain-containing protein [Chaetomium sp. MPI-SDFR-AT-0129]|nr:synaptobrevin-domain-containing protein [Chaetomium sp. MPI-SDFR-AT-0129]